MECEAGHSLLFTASYPAVSDPEAVEQVNQLLKNGRASIKGKGATVSGRYRCEYQLKYEFQTLSALRAGDKVSVTIVTHDTMVSDIEAINRVNWLLRNDMASARKEHFKSPWQISYHHGYVRS